MDNPVSRYTRGEALKKALGYNALMVVWPFAVMIVALMLGLDHYLIDAAQLPASKAHFYHRSFYGIVATVCGWAFVAGTLLSYISNRGTPTRGEVEEQDRRKFNALMLQYPEFQTAHQRKIEDAADDLLDKLDALSVNIPEMKALRDALTWR